MFDMVGSQVDGRVTKFIGISLALVFVFDVWVNFEVIRTYPSWFDEAFFANIAYNYSVDGRLALDVIPGFYEGDVNLYGPVYFFLQANIIERFGLGGLTFRLLNFVAAYLSIGLFACVLRRAGLGWKWLLLFVVFTLVDVSVNRNLVSGRMDMVAVMFASLALLMVSLQSTGRGRLSNMMWLLAGFFSAAAYLTTPRSLFLLAPVLVLGVRHLKSGWTNASRSAGWVGVVIALSTFAVLMGIWIEYVGGVGAYISLYTGSGMGASHIGPSFFRSGYDNVAIGIMLVLCVVNYKAVISDSLLFGFFLAYFLFSLFVNEVGPYAAMIMPFVLAIIVLSLARLKMSLPLWCSILAALALPGLILIGLRGFDLFSNAKCRDADNVLAVMSRMDIEGRVVAPFKYYFLLEGAGRDIVTLEYSKLDREEVILNSSVVVADEGLHEWLQEKGFSRLYWLECSLRRTLFLPNTFYERSVYDEGFYAR